MNIFILGSSCTDSATEKYRGLSQATNNWVKGLVVGLIESGHQVVSIAHIHDALWPKGRLFPGELQDLEPSIPQHLVSYPNIPFFRDRLLSRSLIRGVIAEAESKGMPDVVLTYNLYPYYNYAAKYISRNFQIPWVPIILDLSDPEEDDWAEYSSNSSGACAAVLLSWWGYKNAPTQCKLHLDSGGEQYARKNFKCSEGKKRVVYAGKIAEYGGVELLVSAIESISDKNVEFVICGKGSSESLRILAEKDERVEFKGFVSDEELFDICLEADVFVNPRPNDFGENKMVFPSKILFYLGFGVPVVSTFTPGLSPEYSDVLIISEDDEPTGLGRKIEEVLKWDRSKAEDYRKAVEVFVSDRSWKNQAQRLVEFLTSIL